jgi:hypothetical protein
MKNVTIYLLLSACLYACAVPVKQVHLEQPITPRTGDSFTLASDQSCSYGTGYSRKLRGGTHWNVIGDIQQGAVYRSKDQLLTVEGFDVHEAYIVVKNNYLEGFYLPVEKTFTPASPNPLLSVKPE